MNNRFYVDNYKELTDKQLNKLRSKYVCPGCGEWVNYWREKDGQVYLACHRHSTNHHEGVAKEFTPPDDRITLARRELMETGIMNVNQALAERNLPTAGVMNESQALQVCRVYWPDAPDTNIQAAAYLCRDYGLHPGANHVYLVAYNKKDQNGKVIGKSWEMIWSIAAKRLVAMRIKGQYSYLDDTPRIMSDEEEIKIFGAVDKSKVRAITKLRNMHGMEVSGHGEINASATVKGVDKGNSLLNMAMVRSESRALDRLPGNITLPKMEAIDPEYAEDTQVDTETGEIIEAEAVVIPEPEETKPEPEKKPAPAKNKERPETGPAPDKRGEMEKQGRDAIAEATVVEPELVEPPVEPPDCPIKLELFKEQLGYLQSKRLNGWKNTEVIGKLKEITGKDAVSVTEALSYLTPEQATEWEQHVQSTVEMA